MLHQLRVPKVFHPLNLEICAPADWLWRCGSAFKIGSQNFLYLGVSKLTLSLWENRLFRFENMRNQPTDNQIIHPDCETISDLCWSNGILPSQAISFRHRKKTNFMSCCRIGIYRSLHSKNCHLEKIVFLICFKWMSEKQKVKV